MPRFRTAVLCRRHLVVEKLVRGYSPEEISDQFGTPIHTVYNDMRVIRSGKYNALSSFARDRLVCQLYLNAAARKRALWDMMDKEDLTPRERVAALREDRLNDEHILNRLPSPRKKPSDEEKLDKTDVAVVRSVISKYEERFKEIRSDENLKYLSGPALTEQDREFMAALGIEKHNGEAAAPAQQEACANCGP
jgi:hypothetical protein